MLVSGDTLRFIRCVHADADEIPTAAAIAHVRDCGSVSLPVHLELEFSSYVPRWSQRRWARSYVASVGQLNDTPAEVYRMCGECGRDHAVQHVALGAYTNVPCALAPDVIVHTLTGAGCHMSSYRPPATLAVKYAALSHASDPAYVNWSARDTCRSYLAADKMTYDASQFLPPARVPVPPTLPALLDLDGVRVARHTLASSADALMGIPSPLAHAEVLRPPIVGRVAAACGEGGAWPRGAAPLDPLDPAFDDAGGDPPYCAFERRGRGDAAVRRLLERFGLSTRVREDTGLAVALSVGVGDATADCRSVVGIVRALHALDDGGDSSVGLSAAPLPNGWRVRSHILPLTAEAARPPAGSIGGGYCSRVLSRCRSFAHGVRVSERIGAAVAAAPAPGGDDIWRALNATAGDDLSRGSLDALFIVPGRSSSAGGAPARCDDRVMSIVRRLVAGVRSGGLLVGVSMHDLDSSEATPPSAALVLMACLGPHVAHTSLGYDVIDGVDGDAVMAFQTWVKQ